jgi:hypothetical protein
MAHEMLAGRPPFKAPPVYDRLAGRSIDVPPSIGLACPELPVELTLLVDRALAEDPTTRPTMSEFCVTLSAVAVPPSSGRAKLG